MRDSERLLNLLIKVAAETDDPDSLLDIIREGQKIMVSTFAIYMVLTAQEHKDHKDCAVNKNMRTMLDLFKEQLLADIDKHTEMNLEINGFSLDQSHNEKTRAAILKEMEEKG